jgi:hypothetical protein
VAFEADIALTGERTGTSFNAFTVLVARIGRAWVDLLTARSVCDKARIAFTFESARTGGFTCRITIARF